MCENSEAKLKILLVDQSDHRRGILETILRDRGYENVFSSSGLADICELVIQTQPDVVLIELESPKRDTLEQLREIRDTNPTPVVMFAHDQKTQTVQAAVKSGVCAYLVDSADRTSVQPAIALAMATFDAFRKVKQEAEMYRGELGQRKRIDRAKAILMKHQNLTEEQAHRTLRKMAMDRNMKIGNVATEVIETFKTRTT